VTPWSDARVWAATESHRWYPPACQRVNSEHYELAVTPGSTGLTWIYGFHAQDTREAERLLEEIQGTVRSLGGTGARIWVTPHAQPPGLVDLLLRFRFEPKEEAEVLVFDLRDAIGRTPLPQFRRAEGVVVSEISRREDYDAVDRLSTEVFDLPEPSPEVRARFIELFERQVRETGHSGRFLARVGSRAVGSAGLTVQGAVGLLWGSGVLPEFRGRGIYGELVEARCRSAVDRGAEIALTMARTGTSGPILKRHGFRVVGPIRVYEAQWSEAGRPG